MKNKLISLLLLIPFLIVCNGYADVCPDVLCEGQARNYYWKISGATGPSTGNWELDYPLTLYDSSHTYEYQSMKYDNTMVPFFETTLPGYGITVTSRGLETYKDINSDVVMNIGNLHVGAPLNLSIGALIAQETANTHVGFIYMGQNGETGLEYTTSGKYLRVGYSSGNLPAFNLDGTTGEIRIGEFDPDAQPSPDYKNSYLLPYADGNQYEALVTDGSGQVSFTALTGTHVTMALPDLTDVSAAAQDDGKFLGSVGGVYLGTYPYRLFDEDGTPHVESDQDASGNAMLKASTSILKLSSTTGGDGVPHIAIGDGTPDAGETVLGINDEFTGDESDLKIISSYTYYNPSSQPTSPDLYEWLYAMHTYQGTYTSPALNILRGMRFRVRNIADGVITVPNVSNMKAAQFGCMMKNEGFSDDITVGLFEVNFYDDDAGSPQANTVTLFDTYGNFQAGQINTSIQGVNVKPVVISEASSVFTLGNNADIICLEVNPVDNAAGGTFNVVGTGTSVSGFNIVAPALPTSGQYAGVYLLNTAEAVGTHAGARDQISSIRCLGASLFQDSSFDPTADHQPYAFKRVDVGFRDTSASSIGSQFSVSTNLDGEATSRDYTNCSYSFSHGQNYEIRNAYIHRAYMYNNSDGGASGFSIGQNMSAYDVNVYTYDGATGQWRYVSPFNINQFILEDAYVFEEAVAYRQNQATTDDGGVRRFYGAKLMGLRGTGSGSIVEYYGARLAGAHVASGFTGNTPSDETKNVGLWVEDPTDDIGSQFRGWSGIRVDASSITMTNNKLGIWVGAQTGASGLNLGVYSVSDIRTDGVFNVGGTGGHTGYFDDGTCRITVTGGIITSIAASSGAGCI